MLLGRRSPLPLWLRGIDSVEFGTGCQPGLARSDTQKRGSNVVAVSLADKRLQKSLHHLPEQNHLVPTRIPRILDRLISVGYGLCSARYRFTKNQHMPATKLLPSRANSSSDRPNGL